MIQRVGIFLYGVVAYLSFLGTFLYAVGFIGNIVVPKSIDGEPAVSVPVAILVNAVLLMLFALQHSIMARSGFKKWVTSFIAAAAERSTYVIASNIALIVMFTFWQPVGGVVWHIEDPVGQYILYFIFGLGWLIVFISTFLLDHFDLFGLKQIWHNLKGETYSSVSFRTPLFYKIVRHPLYFGFLLAFWAAPTMTVAHLLFAAASTGYILVAIRFEENDLVREHGRDYERYKEAVPMLIPVRKSERRFNS
jgi:methanethiol S-methyltransferase